MSKDNRGVDLFERNPQLLESISLIQRKKVVEKDWFDTEVNTWFFPAQDVSKLNLRPDIFDKRAAIAIAIMVLLVIPIPFFAIPLILISRRRSRKIDEMRKIQSKLNSMLPARINEARGDYVPKQFEPFVEDLYQEGILFNKVVSGLEMSMMRK